MLSEAAEAYYRRILNSCGGRIKPDDIPDHEVPLVEELSRLALLEPGPETGELVVVDPRLAKIKAGAPHYEAALLTLSAAQMLPSAVARLSEEFHRNIPAGATASGASEILTGRAEIARHIATLTGRCTEELLELRPALPEDDDEVALRQGGQMTTHLGLTRRAILRTAARFVPAHRTYATAIVEAGGEVRTEDLLIEPLLIFDGATAVIPADLVADPAGREAICLLSAPAAVQYLREVFFTIWEDARPFRPDADTANATEVLKESILHLLGQGLDQAAIGRELGLAPRTLTKYIALLKKERNARSLFELGAAVARSKR
jgi:hypothetical protein